MRILVKFERRIAISWSSRSIDLRSRHPRGLRRITDYLCAATAADAIRLKPLKDTKKIYCQIIRLGLSTEFLTGWRTRFGFRPRPYSAERDRITISRALEGR